MLRNVESVIDLTQNYIQKCDEKIKYHNKNSIASKLWNDLFRITKVILTASGSLTLTCMAVYEHNEVSIAVVSACFFFVGSIIDELQKSYNFQFVSSEHHRVSGEYANIKFNLEYSKLDNLDLDKIHSLVENYLSIESKNNIQPVKNCFLGCFYNTSN